MKRTLHQLLTLTAALTLLATNTACTGTDDAQADANTADRHGEPTQAVTFGAYLNRSTRAGYQGVVDASVLADQGFGVFAYYTDNGRYTQQSQPNFMYNQQVTGTTVGGTTTWDYQPLKYWPNEYGTGAYSDDEDRLTFFAYAPWVAVKAASGELDDTYNAAQKQQGITALTSHTAGGDPKVYYATTFRPEEAVDLCYAEAGSQTTDLLKPALGTHVPFSFRHALAQLNVRVDAAVDATTAGTPLGTNQAAATDGCTRIWVRSVTIEGFATHGLLNLYSTVGPVPRWLNTDGSDLPAATPVTLHDGRRNGSEAKAPALNETGTVLNPAIVQSDGYYNVTAAPPAVTTATPGVTHQARNLFDAATDGACVMVIPNGMPLRITVAYDVETYDPNLRYQYLSDGRTTGSSIENVITATVKTGGDELVLEAGKSYEVTLHLGMNSVKLEADNVGWKTGTDATGCLDTYTAESHNTIGSGGDGMAVIHINEPTYTGCELEPKPIVTDPTTGQVLTEGTHYTLTYDGDHTNATSTDAKVTATGIGAYTGKSAYTGFDIHRKHADYDWVQVSQTLFLADGTEMAPTITVKDPTHCPTEVVLTEHTDYEVEGVIKSAEAGNYYIVVHFIGNYEGEVVRKWTVTEPIHLKYIAKSSVVPYTGLDTNSDYLGTASGTNNVMSYPNDAYVEGTDAATDTRKYYVEGLMEGHTAYADVTVTIPRADKYSKQRKVDAKGEYYYEHDYDVVINATNLKVLDAEGNDVTLYYNTTGTPTATADLVNGLRTITPQDITYRPTGAHTESVDGSAYTGDVTVVDGEYQKAFGYDDKLVTVAVNYASGTWDVDLSKVIIMGALGGTLGMAPVQRFYNLKKETLTKVTLTIKAKDTTVPYAGKTTNDDYDQTLFTVDGLLAGHHIVSTSAGKDKVTLTCPTILDSDGVHNNTKEGNSYSSTTHVSTYKVTVTQDVTQIVDDYGNDVTHVYDINYADGTRTVTPQTITFTPTGTNTETDYGTSYVTYTAEPQAGDLFYNLSSQVTKTVSGSTSTYTWTPNTGIVTSFYIPGPGYVPLSMEKYYIKNYNTITKTKQHIVVAAKVQDKISYPTSWKNGSTQPYNEYIICINGTSLKSGHSFAGNENFGTWEFKQLNTFSGYYSSSWPDFLLKVTDVKIIDIGFNDHTDEYDIEYVYPDMSGDSSGNYEYSSSGYNCGKWKTVSLEGTQQACKGTKGMYIGSDGLVSNSDRGNAIGRVYKNDGNYVYMTVTTNPNPVTLDLARSGPYWSSQAQINMGTDTYWPRLMFSHEYEEAKDYIPAGRYWAYNSGNLLSISIPSLEYHFENEEQVQKGLITYPGVGILVVPVCK